MAGSVNKVMIMGTIAENPDSRTTPGGAKTVTLKVITVDSYENREGVRKSHTERHTVVCWGPQAEIAEGLRMGTVVHVEGKLQQRSWEDQQTGQKRYMTEVMAREVTPAEPQNPNDRGDDGGGGSRAPSGGGGQRQQGNGGGGQRGGGGYGDQGGGQGGGRQQGAGGGAAPSSGRSRKPGRDDVPF